MLSRGDLGVPRDWGVRRPPSERRGTLAGRGISEREECRGESVGSPELRAAGGIWGATRSVRGWGKGDRGAAGLGKWAEHGTPRVSGLPWRRDVVLETTRV